MDGRSIGRSAPDGVADLVRSWINGGQLGPGDRLPNERTLAVDLSVSRLTLREALRQLTAEGYLTARRGNGGGTFVTDLIRPQHTWVESARRRPEWVADLIEYRKAVETRAAGLAAARRTPAQLEEMRSAVADCREPGSRAAFRNADHRFHRALAQASGSARLADAIEAVRGQMFMPIDALNYEDHFAQTFREHTAVLRAVERGSVSGAARAVERHLDGSLRDLLELLRIPQPVPVPSRESPSKI